MPTQKRKPESKNKKMVGFGGAIVRFWKNYANFSGTAQRGECFFAFVFVFAVYVLIYESAFYMPTIRSSLFVDSWARIIWIVTTFIPCMSLSERRVRDAGFYAGWVWVPCLVLWLIRTPFSDSATWCFAIFALIVSLLPSKLKK